MAASLRDFPVPEVVISIKILKSNGGYAAEAKEQKKNKLNKTIQATKNASRSASTSTIIALTEKKKGKVVYMHSLWKKTEKKKNTTCYHVSPVGFMGQMNLSGVFFDKKQNIVH
jgi:hypothetical protein